jgi:DNA-binding transcriptional ArsR family regulator
MTLADPGSANAIFAALADPTRRRILEILSSQRSVTTNELAARFPVTRWAVMKHLAVLQGAGLVQTLPAGRRRLHFLEQRRLELVREWLAGLP